MTSPNLTFVRASLSNNHFFQVPRVFAVHRFDFIVYKQIHFKTILIIYLQYLNDLLCQTWGSDSTDCIVQNSSANCADLLPFELEENICALKRLSGLEQVAFSFPADEDTQEVAEFFEGESGHFFQQFNSFTNGEDSDKSYAKLMKSLTLYGTKFDLSSLSELTSSKTEEVLVMADTIITSKPFSIHYKLKVVGRVVAISHKVTMNMTR